MSNVLPEFERHCWESCQKPSTDCPVFQTCSIEANATGAVLVAIRHIYIYILVMLYECYSTTVVDTLIVLNDSASMLNFGGIRRSDKDAQGTQQVTCWQDNFIVRVVATAQPVSPSHAGSSSNHRLHNFSCTGTTDLE